MKKIFALILTVALLFSLMTVTASAEEGMSDIQCTSGETVTVCVSLPKSYNKVKSVAIEVCYDEVFFEYVSYKWIPTFFIKSYTPDTKQGVAAASTPMDLSGDIFEITLKVRDDAPYDNTKIDFNLQIADKNTTVYENISYSVYVGEYVEVDDETTPDDFIAALDNITEVNADEDTYAAIVEALDIYSALTATEKAEVEDAYAKLINIIGEYNTASDSINTEAQTATSIAFSVLSGAIEYISKLLAVLRQMIWG